MSRQRVVNNLNKKSSRAVRSPNEAARLNGSAGGAAQHHDDNDNGPQAASRMSVAGVLLDYSFMLFLVIGGCCSNVWAYEELLRAEPNVGPALTFSQMLFITAQQLPWLWLPRLKPRQVPISQYLLQVTTFASGTLLNNLVFAFSVPPTLQIVFRSAGLAVSMLLGRFFMDKHYTLKQTMAVAIVSSGVIIATLFRPRTESPITIIRDSGTATNYTSTIDAATAASTVDPSRYTLGIAMLLASLVCTGIHGALQEHTYSTYGPYWRESIFYTHMLSLPMFAIMPQSVRRGFVGLSRPKNSGGGGSPYDGHNNPLLTTTNSSSVSAVSTQVVLTTRKAISLCFSVWWFGSGWNAQLAAGAVMVFIGSFWYSVLPASVRVEQNRDGKREKTN
ncbi:UAA transporter family-domain-containing protein [Russula aff. rugulosa BPL654]|nr:UAA transporter family-domain-containing protein [Russula aff. rugulosa BPL654]